MTDRFSMEAKWLSAEGDDPAEAVTTAEVTVSADGISLSQIFDPDSGQTVDGPILPTLGLSEGLARRWWQLLYEPQRTPDREPRFNFEFRHRLDGLTAGYVFPPIGLWSGGETVMVGLFRPDTRFQTQSFVLSELPRPVSAIRGDVEQSLGSFVTSTIERIGRQNARAVALREDWDRIVSSTHDPEEREWCTNSGRLGLDPYDPDTVDLGRMTAGLNDTLFADICEAADIADLWQTCEWARTATARFRNTKPISVKGFGGPPYRDLSSPGWRNGHEAVELLRQRLSLPIDPRQAMRRLFDDPENADGDRFPDTTPNALEGVARREGMEIRANVPARSVRQKRFRTCRATYLGWRVGSGTDIAITPAETWHQQASRAFAAELLAPAKLIQDRYGKTGLNSFAIERLASEWLCPPRIIVHQAKNHKIPVKGGDNAAVF